MIGPWVIMMLACHSWPGQYPAGALPAENPFRITTLVDSGFTLPPPATNDAPADDMLYPFVCLNPIGADQRPIRYCGGQDRLGLSWVLVLDPMQCRSPSQLAVGAYPMKGHPRSFWIDSGMYQWIADWDGPLDPDRDGDWDVDDIQTVLDGISIAELPGPRLGDVCPVICSDGTIDIEDLMATIWGFEGHFECGW